MRVISIKTLREFWVRHPQAEIPLRGWYTEVSDADWRTPADIKAIHRNASCLANNRVIFNIKGNNFRLVVAIRYGMRPKGAPTPINLKCSPCWWKSMKRLPTLVEARGLMHACYDNFIFYLPKVTSILRHPWLTKFRGKLSLPATRSKAQKPRAECVFPQSGLSRPF